MSLKNDKSEVIDLLPQLPPNASRIVEYGLSQKNLFKRYSEINPTVDYYSMNHSFEKKQKVSIINKEGQNLINCDAECFSLMELGIQKKSVDCILLLNVLENMINPWTFLNNQVEFLSDDGIIIAVFDNFGHGSNFYNLIIGQWLYGDYYKTQKNKIRFFNASTILELFKTSGLCITKHFRKIEKDNKYELFVSIFSNAFKQMNVDIGRFKEQATTLKYIIHAKKDQEYYQKIPAHMQDAVSGKKPAYDMEKMKLYYKYKFLPQLPVNASRVVEFGQFSTDIFKLYSAANPAVDYYTIKHSLGKPQSTVKAIKFGSKHICGNAEQISLSEMGIKKNSVDCIIILNVLESMIDPLGFLMSLIDYLSKNGTIVAVFNNLGYWVNLYGLINGIWEYGNERLPSIETIRFYNFSTICDLFDSAGYHINTINRLYKEDKNYETFVSILSNPLEQLNVDMLKFREQAITQNYIIQAKRKEATANRKASNLYFQEVCKTMGGDILNIGSSDDQDKMGGLYKDYFENTASYIKLDSDQNHQADIVGNIENLKGVISDNSFDVVFCIWVLEHVKDVYSAISELHRILRHNGHLIFGIPLNLEFHSFPDDYHRFTAAGFQELLKNKFRMIQIKPSGPEKLYHHDNRLNLFGQPPKKAPPGYMGICQKR